MAAPSMTESPSASWLIGGSGAVVVAQAGGAGGQVEGEGEVAAEPPSGLSAAASEGPAAERAVRVLVVEDEPDIAALIAYQLTREGFRVETASTGPEALKAVNREVPDLVVLDRMLPGMDGVEVCRTLKTRDSTHAIPVIMLTAKGEEIDRVVGFEVGADDYVVKPFAFEELLARIQAQQRRRQQAELRPPVDPAEAGPTQQQQHADTFLVISDGQALTTGRLAASQLPGRVREARRPVSPGRSASGRSRAPGSARRSRAAAHPRRAIRLRGR